MCNGIIADKALDSDFQGTGSAGTALPAAYAHGAWPPHEKLRDYLKSDLRMPVMDSTFEMPSHIEFGRFSILPRSRELFAEGKLIELGARAFDVLMALIETPGAVNSKSTLIERVWPARIVEENSLHAQISALRKAFGADRDLIRTITGRGYQFTGEVRTVSKFPNASPTSLAFPAPPAAQVLTNLPASVSDLIGRDVELDKLLDLTASHRLVTLVGAGGIGKTRLGLEAARHLLPRFVDGVWIAELATISDPRLVAVTVATALGIEISGSAVSMARIANALGRRHLVLVLDNCEHLIDAAAEIVEVVLRTDPAARVIATSRDPLRVEGEAIFPVPPLAVPTGVRWDSEDLQRYGAVQLFVERARATAPHFSPDAGGVATIAGICGRLDGIPLAIELAAARASALGIKAIASRLDDRFALLTGGRRTALPRYQTLRATLDWSYNLLPDIEGIVLRRIAVFAGSFTPEGVGIVAASVEITSSAVVDCVINLVGKSLVTADVVGTETRWRLLETTRAYALEKLTESGEQGEVARRHAEYYRNLFQQATTESEMRPVAEWLATYRHDIDNVRAALDWAFSPGGDSTVGVALTISSAPHWLQVSRIEECRGRIERALECAGSRLGQDEHLAMQLHAAHAMSLMLLKGHVPEAHAAWAKTLELGTILGDTDYQLRALLGLFSHQFGTGAGRTAEGLAEQFRIVAAGSSDSADELIGDLMMAILQLHRGNLTDARCHAERMLQGYYNPAPASHTIRFFYEQRETARAVLARVLWFQGFPDQAMHIVRSIAEYARSCNHAPSACLLLGGVACPISLLAGDSEATEYFLAMLFDRSARHSLDIWAVRGRCVEGMLQIGRGDAVSGVRHLKTAIDELRDTGFAPPNTIYLGAAAEGLANVGRVQEGLATINDALEQCSRNEEFYCFAELMRMKGVLILAEGATGAPAAAEDHFLQALDYARRHGALSWELRSATSLARTWRDQDRRKDAHALLVSVYERFTEGFATSDLRAAKALIDEIS
jgi:predicted ATPase/DNA-binding winged helix-turn-helix (wHTH) protein